MADDALLSSSDEEHQPEGEGPPSPFVMKYRRAVQIAEDIGALPLTAALAFSIGIVAVRAA